MARTTANEPDKKIIGQRLRLTRESMRLTQVEFARRAGIAPNTYNQFETGMRLVPPGRAIAICDAYSLTLDWIYRGRMDDLPTRLSKAIEALREMER